MNPWIDRVDEGLLFDCSYDAIYQKLYKLEVEPHVIFATPKHYNPHWFRGQRAAFLRINYNFTTSDLKNFFQWESFEMADHYAQLGGIPIGEKMLQARKNMNKL